jgi:hypothetical protein
VEDGSTGDSAAVAGLLGRRKLVPLPENNTSVKSRVEIIDVLNKESD